MRAPAEYRYFRGGEDNPIVGDERLLEVLCDNKRHDSNSGILPNLFDNLSRRKQHTSASVEYVNFDP